MFVASGFIGGCRTAFVSEAHDASPVSGNPSVCWCELVAPSSTRPGDQFALRCGNRSLATLPRCR